MTVIANMQAWGSPLLLALVVLGASMAALAHVRYRRALRELEAEQKRLLTVYEKSPAAVMTIAPDLTVTYANTKVEEIVGAPAEEIIGHSCHESIVGLGEPCDGCLVSQVFETGKPASRIKHELTAAGRENWLSQTWYPLLDAQGRIESVVEIASDISGLKLDPLTSLPNRVLLRDRLDVALASARRHGQRVALLFMDIDGFKEINDTAGHAAGDAALIGLAERLRGIVRQDETLARLGGDEFVLLLPAVGDGGDAVRIAERVEEHLEAPFVDGTREICITVSIGIAFFDGGDESAEQLLDRADKAMYVAKGAGGRGYAIADPAEG